MINIQDAIFALNPSVVNIIGDIAYNANEQEVTYNMAQAEAKMAKLAAQAQADAQAVIDTKASALAKLAALGLTEEELKSLL